MSSGRMDVTPFDASLISSCSGGWLCLRCVFSVTLDALRLFSLLLKGFIRCTRLQDPFKEPVNFYNNHNLIINQFSLFEFRFKPLIVN